MKFRFNNREKILVTMETLICEIELKFIKRHKNILLYAISEENLEKGMKQWNNVIYYLDYFVLIMPETYAKQKSLWSDFYDCFADVYECLIDKKQNLNCIEMMLWYIDKEIKLGKNHKILDYGCGSGLSATIEHNGEIFGYEPSGAMRDKAKNRGLKVYDKQILKDMPDNFFDAVFASYVFHMAIDEQDILQFIPKMKKNAIWIANFYKNLNVEIVNNIFKKNGFSINRVEMQDERFGHVYEYRRK